MPYAKQTTELLELAAKILLRCSALGYLLLLIWFICVVFLPGLIQGVSEPFDLTPHEINVVNYGAMALLKICVLVFFLLPYVSIRLILRARAE